MSETNRLVFAGLIGALLGFGLVLILQGNLAGGIPLLVMGVALAVVMRSAGTRPDESE